MPLSSQKSKSITQNPMHLEPIYIVGPTASGKSEFAFQLAKQMDGVIISADSMQIYKGLDIGTAKESNERRHEVEHQMIDIIDADAEFSVAEYADMARFHIKSALERGKLPIVVGGTGLYFEALLYPMSFSGAAKNTKLREDLENELNGRGAESMHAKLKQYDPVAAEKLHPNDTKRVIRALEIALTTGKSKSDSADDKVHPDVIIIGFNTDRAKLYERINERVELMFGQGLADEVQKIGRFDCQSMQAIGYKEFSGYDLTQNCAETTSIDKVKASNNTKIAEIKEKIKKNTRNYAKRQLTWFKRYPFVVWFECGDFDNAMNYIVNKLEKTNN